MDSYTCINTQWFNMQVPSLTTLLFPDESPQPMGQSPELLILDENQKHWPSLPTHKVTALPQVSHDGQCQVGLSHGAVAWSGASLGTAIASIFRYQRCCQTMCGKSLHHPMPSAIGRDDGDDDTKQGLVK